MVTLVLTETEARLLARLLDKAGETYGSHGCNDFDLRKEIGLSHEQAIEVAHELRAAMLDAQVIDDAEELERKSPYLLDWLLMAYFEKRLRALLPGGLRGKGA